VKKAFADSGDSSDESERYKAIEGQRLYDEYTVKEREVAHPQATLRRI
jgi:hypothetical protein